MPRGTSLGILIKWGVSKAFDWSAVGVAVGVGREEAPFDWGEAVAGAGAGAGGLGLGSELGVITGVSGMKQCSLRRADRTLELFITRFSSAMASTRACRASMSSSGAPKSEGIQFPAICSSSDAVYVFRKKDIRATPLCNNVATKCRFTAFGIRGRIVGMNLTSFVYNRVMDEPPEGSGLMIVI
eukprot:CAMPEP_0184645868 /NCGR_PEP_ID=MMETSP0308-20130426/2449_1 /TAXON_ID=38269 /ORGANISM="Gloeochaete witrockiana, Strain SAG 46.84" /LENGTH=183 /DNA_ID=CAMNT_0027075315 /DNA_START=77 /DNA_END=628 /DNA_ORIENTATION=-